jgi:VanZ family protein
MLDVAEQKPRWPVLILSAYAVMLVTATHIPTQRVPILFSAQDKALHLACYAVLAFLAFFAALSQRWVVTTSTLAAVKVLAATCLFGIVDELTQFFVPGRLVDALDLVANSIGCLIGTIVFMGVVRALRPRELA